MRSFYRAILYFFFLFAPLVSPAAVLDRIVAIVNDDVITLTEVQRYVKVEKEGKFTSVNEYFRNMKIREKVDSFVDDLLIRQQAKKLRIEVSDKDIGGVIENIKRQYLITEEELKASLKKDNVSFRDFSEGIRMNMLRNRVLARVISPEMNITDNALKSYYEKNIEQFREEEYKLQHILVSGKREDAQMRALAAYNQLKEGVAFEMVAATFSDDPSRSKGGDIGYVRGEDLIPELRQAISLLMPGTHTHALQTPYGWHILRLEEVKKGDALPFEAVKDRIHGKLVQEEGERRYKDFVEKLRRSSYIEVKI